MTTKQKHRVLKRRRNSSDRKRHHREARRQARTMKSRVAGAR